MLLQAPRTSLADSAANSIRAEIAAGRWAVGSRIPIEPQLAQLLGVSRGTVREAVKTLVSRGLLEVRQGSGTYVRSGFDPSASLQKMRRASLRDQFEVRRALEVEAARLAAVRHTAKDLRNLKTLLEKRGVPDASDGGAGFIERDLGLSPGHRRHLGQPGAGRNLPLHRGLHQGNHRKHDGHQPAGTRHGRAHRHRRGHCKPRP
ncbi:DNA-binding FadR family transcriptional regulator [Variovorax paradoxus]|nr:DNA-binding FadR family transcriptional regulator [Variovorax paradoxus]